MLSEAVQGAERESPARGTGSSMKTTCAMTQAEDAGQKGFSSQILYSPTYSRQVSDYLRNQKPSFRRPPVVVSNSSTSTH